MIPSYTLYLVPYSAPACPCLKTARQWSSLIGLAVVKFEKSSPERLESFERLMPGDPDIMHRKLFGYPACFINGNMFA